MLCDHPRFHARAPWPSHGPEEQHNAVVVVTQLTLAIPSRVAQFSESRIFHDEEIQVYISIFHIEAFTIYSQARTIIMQRCYTVWAADAKLIVGLIII
jgi:hypothetical protein